METRIERNKNRKKQKRKEFFKFQLLILCIVIFILGLMATENSIQELTCIENQRLFFVLLKEDGLHIQLFGKSYVFKLTTFIKNIIEIMKWPG